MYESMKMDEISENLRKSQKKCTKICENVRKSMKTRGESMEIHGNL